MRRTRSLALLLLLLQLPLTVSAQTEDPDLGLLAGQLGSAPNVMILFDTSESMRHVVWANGFNPKVFYDAQSGCTGVNASSNMRVYRDQSLNEKCPGSGSSTNGGTDCPNNDAYDLVTPTETFFIQAIETPTITSGFNPPFSYGPLATVQCPRPNPQPTCGTSGTASGFPTDFGCRVFGSGSDRYIQITLPDVDGVETLDTPNETTHWSANYVHWLMLQQKNGTFPANLPRETRKMAAKRVLTDVIRELNPGTAPNIEQRVRFGLARLDPTFDVYNGGYVVQAIADNNTSSVLTALSGSSIDAPKYARTQLSEALVDIARYFVGDLNPATPLPGKKGLGSYPIYDRNTTNGASGSPQPSPIEPNITCRENFVIIVTDGQPTKDENNHFTGNPFNATFGGSGSDPNALPRVAGYLAQNDLIDNTVMPGKQDIVTYTIGLTLDVQLLRNTADAGDGEYFTANTANELGDHLRTSLQDIVLRAGSFTAAAVPATRSAFGDGFYTTFFEPQRRGVMYQGHLQAYRITENFDIVGPGINPPSALDPNGTLVGAPFWDAATLLKDANNVRNLYVTPLAGGPVTPFTSGPATKAFTAANLTAAHLNVTSTDLPKYVSPPAAPIANAEALADALVQYVRGDDRFDEDTDNNVTERRKDLDTSAVLGDIFHSSPRVVGPPPFDLLSEPGFGQPLGDPNSFLGRYGKRDKLIYAGANDGMLHAFDAGKFVNGDNPLTTNVTEAGFYDMGSGIEKFGWVPRSVLPTLKQLTLPGPHPFYVDGPITVADAWFPSSSTDFSKGGNEWTTALVVGMRNGANAYLALDVTDPSLTDPNAPHGPFPKLLWEFIGTPTEPLGKSWSRAVITRVRLRGSHSDDYCGPSNGDGSSGPGQPGNCREEWVAIFGAGYTEQGDPSSTQYVSDPNAAGNNVSKGIYMVSLATGTVLARVSYQAGTTPLAEMKYSFPSEPAVLDLNFDGFADVVYIGDTGGQLWKWDISATGVLTSGLVPTSVWPVNRFFVAPTGPSPANHKRSFFYPPTASFVAGKLMLGIGTGERTKADYRTATGEENRYYVIQDRTPTGTGAFAGLPLGEGNLTLLAPNGVDTNTSDYGFYLIADRDEKFISDSLTFSGFVVTASYVPKPSNPLAPCEGGGQSNLYIFSLANGAGFFPASEPGRIDSRRVNVGTGLPSSASVTVSGDRARVTLQMSDRSVKSRGAPSPNEAPVDLIYWQQEF